MTTLTHPIAEGRTAEVFPWETGLVLKLYRDWCPPDWVERELMIATRMRDSAFKRSLAGGE